MTILAKFNGTYRKHEETNAATRYVIHAVHIDSGEVLCAVESGWGGNHGEWILLVGDAIAWSYLVEKMPIMSRSNGDKPGWKKAFAAVGIEIFG